ncbi:MAG: hypothetical protein KDA42_02520 [Planctomycetales bacterium]|nr:hypothetical protein [Planctomycetales bacterium]
MARRKSDDAAKAIGVGIVMLVVLAIALIGGGIFFYESLFVFVPTRHVAIMIKKTGLDLPNGEEVAPSEEHKGVQREFLKEGRYFRNPYTWDWEIEPAFEVPAGKSGVRVRLVGDDPAYGQLLALNENEKGIVSGYLREGRYEINPYLERIEVHDPVVIPAGHKGVITILSGPLPPDPNVLLVPPAANGAPYVGVQEQTIDPQTYYFNPYEERVSRVDCRSQRFNLADKKDMGFPSKDGFWVSLDGIVEFRVKPEEAARVFVTYNEDHNGDDITEEIVSKIILPNARSFCRLEGSQSLGREFIEGDTRIAFQKKFQDAMRQNCDPLGIEIIQALITRITPPEPIAEPVRAREIAKQEEKQYKQQILQQESEKTLAVEKAMVTRKTELVKAEQEVVKITTLAEQEQQVAVTKANQELAVAEFKLEAAKDEAEAVLARGKAEAEVVQFENKAEAAGWQRSVEAFSGDGQEFARYVMFQKLSSAYRDIMVNTADSPIMKIFDSFTPTSSDSAKVKP